MCRSVLFVLIMSLIMPLMSLMLFTAKVMTFKLIISGNLAGFQSFKKTLMAFVNDINNIIKDINDQISFETIPIASGEPSDEQLYEKERKENILQILI